MRKITGILAFLLCATLVCGATDYVVISEVMYDTPLNENVESFPHNYGEYIELCNIGERSADIGGWQLSMPSPVQTFTIPSPCVLEPHSFLVIAYGTAYTYSALNLVNYDSNEYPSDFHYMYDIHGDSICPIIFQTSLLLPNDNQHSLVLKDANQVTRDSMFYGYSPSWNTTTEATNTSVNSIDDVDAYSLCSVKRITIDMKISGYTIFHDYNWGNCVEPGSISNTIGCSQYYLHSSIYMPPVTQTIHNYVMDITPTEATDDLNVRSDTSIIADALVSVNYYDGLGRLKQTVARQVTPAMKNLVSFTEYDNFDRPLKQWNPVPTELSRLTTQTVSPNASMYYTGETRPYQEFLYSTDELTAGIRKNAAIGEQKAGADMNNHHTSTLTRANEVNEVKLYKVNASGGLVCSGYYGTKMLLCEQCSDENNKIVCTFKDNQDRIIMQRAGSNYDTYYVYNDLGQLSYVLPPAACDALGQGTYSSDNDALKKYAYLYRYDNRGRCTYKRLPGCNPMWLYYDKAGRLVCSCDGNQYQKEQSSITLYDRHSRPIYIFDNEVQDVGYFMDDLEDILEIAQAIADTINGSSNAPQLTDTYYTLPLITESEGKMLRVVNYYDNYAFIRHSNNAAILQYDNTKENIYGAKTNKTKGLLTGTRTYMLNDANSYTETAYYYDYRGRVIQQRSTNHFGGTNITYTAYSFAGQITKKYETKSTSNAINPPIREQYDFSYDHAGRLAQILYTYNDDAPIVLSQHTYDELGRMTCKHILNNLDSICYSYNIRNQLTRINSGTFEENMYYTSQNLNYNLAPFTPSYNGNIAMNTWRHDGGQVNGYMYGYDAYNRLSGAQAVLNSQWAESGQYSEGFVYDKQGNITTILRYNNEDVIDYLSLLYNGNRLVSVQNNEWAVVPDYNTMHYQDLADETTEMGYDANGNLIYDKDRGISTVRYNVLNLPDRIQYSNGNQTMHEYDALGNRVRTTYYTRKSLTAVPIGNILHPENNTSDYTITVDGFNENIVYTKVNPAVCNGTTWMPKFVHNPEGLTRHYSYEEHYPFYFIKDHLGNIRETYIKPAPNTKYLIQRMQYYPSGIPWKTSTGANEHPYRYSGKELVQMHGQDEYDSHARWYYPAICRTTTMDPLCEKYYNISPYAWCENNMANCIDPDGKSTHTNECGVVVAVYDDGDLNIYKHPNEQLESWGDVYENPLTAEGAEVMGQTLHALSFADQQKYNETGNVSHADGMIINFGSTALGDAVREVVRSQPSLLEYALNARSKHEWDFKEQTQYENKGSQISDGIYLSPRDAGNVLAGAIKYQSGILAPIVQFGYGAYNLTHNNIPKTALLTVGTAFLIYKYPQLGIPTAAMIMNSEDKLTQLSINLGYKLYGEK